MIFRTPIACLDGYRHWLLSKLPIALCLPFKRERKLPLFHATYNSCCVLSGKCVLRRFHKSVNGSEFMIIYLTICFGVHLITGSFHGDVLQVSFVVLFPMQHHNTVFWMECRIFNVNCRKERNWASATLQTTVQNLQMAVATITFLAIITTKALRC